MPRPRDQRPEQRDGSSEHAAAQRRGAADRSTTPRSHSLDRRIEVLARRQHGALNRSQALAAGLTSDQVAHRLATGAWLALDRGVYALASHPASWRRQAMAATLAVRGSAVAGRSAGALQGIDGFSPGRIELVTSRRHRRARTRLAIVRSIPAVDPAIVDGIPCLRVVDLVVDLAARLERPALEQLVDDLLAGRRTTVSALEDQLPALAHGRRPGAGLLRSVVLARSPDAPEPDPSALERLLRSVLRAPGMPPAIAEVPMPWWPAGRGRVDAHLPGCALIVEADGRRWHTREADFVRDRRRDNLATAHGHGVLRFTWTDLRSDPDDCRDIVRRAAIERGWRPTTQV